MITESEQRVAELENELKRLLILLVHNDHPVRAKIGLWLEARPSGSPVEFHRANKDIDLGVISYHFKTMESKGLIVLIKTRPRRGATEHYYRLTSKHPLYKT